MAGERRSLAARLRRWWVKRVVRRALATDHDRARKFALIHRLNYWGNAESVSGNGSSLDSTAVFRAGFESLLRRHRIGRLFDAPCGDWNWMQAVSLPEGCDYVGGDIVAAVIADNQARHGRAGVRFVVFDLVAQPLPPADLWLCRDCLIHLSNRDITTVFNNFLASGTPWMLVTSHPHVIRNGDIVTGQYRDVNLQIAPFSLPPPREAVEDRPVGEAARSVGLWHRDDLLAAGFGGRP